jgi:adenosylcobinamide kinase/adenosylcobinamide-phosphate guanylyltransferase
MTAGLPPVTLVLGGARSGKSRHAETLVEAQPGACIYLATAEPGDAGRAGKRWRNRSTCRAPCGARRGPTGPCWSTA